MDLTKKAARLGGDPAAPSRLPQALSRPLIVPPVGPGVRLPAAALSYALAGMPVFPVHATGPRAKQPMTRHGHRDAATNIRTVRNWWQDWPAASIGYAPPPGMIVLDIDRPDAVADLEAINGGPLPETLTVRTGRTEGGWHLYYLTERADLTQGVVRRSDGRPVHGVDVRLGGRGYLILPPSVHATSGTPYRWLNTTSPAPLPDALEAACAPVAPRPMPLPSHLPASGDGALEGLLRTVRDAAKGTRNRALFWAACRMSERDRAGLATNWPGLTAAASAAGLSTREIRATVASATAAAAREGVPA